MNQLVWLVLGLGAMAFSIPGPCSYDAHEELDCDFSANEATCPEGLACAPDDHCKPADVACDRVEDNVACNGVCINTDDFLEDVNNCGGCGTVCADGEACCAGACLTVDVSERCGACNVSCNLDETCFEGACRAACLDDVDCPAAGDVCCDDLCSDGTVDERCGGCDIACNAEESETCVEQVCRTSCSNDGDCPGSRCCDGLCVDPGDPQHCGACDEPCGPDTVCLDDTCAPECDVDRACGGANEECCSGRCVDLTGDDDNCGACGDPCVGAQRCHDSECRTGRDRDCCGAQCTDCTLQQGRTCENGQCVRCNIYAQDCAATGDGGTATCVLVEGVTVPEGFCIPALAPPAPGRNEQCSATSPQVAECLAGFDCLRINAAVSTCTAFCDPFVFPAPQCEATEDCFQVQAGPGELVGLCAPKCNLDATFTCTHGDLTGTCFPIAACTGDGSCAPVGPAAEGAACAGFADCAADLVCDPSSSTCRRMCRSIGVACPTGGTCTSTTTFNSCTEIGLCL